MTLWKDIGTATLRKWRDSLTDTHGCCPKDADVLDHQDACLVRHFLGDEVFPYASLKACQALTLPAMAMELPYVVFTAGCQQ